MQYKKIIRYNFTSSSAISHWADWCLLVNSLNTQYALGINASVRYGVPMIPAVIDGICAYSFEGRFIAEGETSEGVGKNWPGYAKFLFSLFRILDETITTITNYAALRGFFATENQELPLAHLSITEYALAGIFGLVFCGSFLYFTELCELFDIQHHAPPTIKPFMQWMYSLTHTFDHFMWEAPVIGNRFSTQTKTLFAALVALLDIPLVLIPTYAFEAKEAVNNLCQNDPEENDKPSCLDLNNYTWLAKAAYTGIPLGGAGLKAMEFLMPLVLLYFSLQSELKDSYDSDIWLPVIFGIVGLLTLIGGFSGSLYSEGTQVQEHITDILNNVDDRRTSRFSLTFRDNNDLGNMMNNNIDNDLLDI